MDLGGKTGRVLKPVERASRRLFGALGSVIFLRLYVAINVLCPSLSLPSSPLIKPLTSPSTPNQTMSTPPPTEQCAESPARFRTRDRAPRKSKYNPDAPTKDTQLECLPPAEDDHHPRHASAVPSRHTSAKQTKTTKTQAELQRSVGDGHRPSAIEFVASGNFPHALLSLHCSHSFLSFRCIRPSFAGSCLLWRSRVV